MLPRQYRPKNGPRSHGDCRACFRINMNFKLRLRFAVVGLFGVGFSLSAAPNISSFTPAYGASSDPTSIIILGSGFYPGTLVVKFNGVIDPTAIAASADGSTIQAHVPIGAPLGPGPIYVSVNGSPTTSTADFTVIGPEPYIGDFSPKTGGAGTLVTLTGAHFFSGGQYGTLTVKFSGAAATAASSGDGVTLLVNAPSGVVTGPITVANAKGASVTTGYFYAAPRISGFSPTFGRAGTNVFLTGTNFLGATNVQFNSLNAPDFTVFSNTMIRVSVPNGASTGKIRVGAPANAFLTTSNFVLEPTVSSFAPTFGAVGASVTVFGANLDAAPVVRFNGILAGTPTGVSPGQLTAVVPAGATTGPITVTTSNGNMTSSAKFYLPAGLKSVAPLFGPAGTPITILGTNFVDASAVTFQDTPAAAFSVQASNSIGAIVPFGVSSGWMTVTTPAGTATNSAVKFYVAPIISAFSPSRGLPGTNVTIFGQNFLDASAVRFNGSNATFTVLNNTTISAIAPTNVQTGPITVIAPAGTNVTVENFVYDYSANLVLSATDAPDPVFVGSNLLYTINIFNSGPFAAPGVAFTNILPPGVNLVNATTTQGTLNTNGNPVTGNLGQLNNGGTAIVTLTVSPQTTGFLTNIVAVASSYLDPTPANNGATNGTFVQAIPKLTVGFVAPNLVRLGWSATLTNYTLEAKTNPTAGAWAGVGGTPTTVGSQLQLLQTNIPGTRYFRLHRVP